VASVVGKAAHRLHIFHFQAGQINTGRCGIWFIFYLLL